MEIGEVLRYKGYTISHPRQKDYVTEIAHDSLQDAKEFIEELLDCDLLEKVED